MDNINLWCLCLEPPDDITEPQCGGADHDAVYELFGRMDELGKNILTIAAVSQERIPALSGKFLQVKKCWAVTVVYL